MPVAVIGRQSVDVGWILLVTATGIRPCGVTAVLGGVQCWSRDWHRGAVVNVAAGMLAVSSVVRETLVAILGSKTFIVRFPIDLDEYAI